MWYTNSQLKISTGCQASVTTSAALAGTHPDELSDHQMAEFAPVLIVAVFFAFLFAALLAFIGVTILYIRNRLQSVGKANQQLEERLGLVNHNADSSAPDLRGTINGINVRVDVVYQQYARSGSSIKSSLRAWTRVRAELPVAPLVEVRSRHQRLEDPFELPARPTGDRAFDQKYETYAADDVDLAIALPLAAREALVAAEPPVHILKNAATWMQGKLIGDANLLEQAIYSCTRVASTFDHIQPEILE